jgi:adenylate cyclase class 2
MEIELRAFIDDFESLREKLKKLDAKKIDETEIEDVWYCEKHITSYEETKMNKIGSYGLRIRNQKGREPEVCIKTIMKENDHQVFGEFETAFTDVNQMRKIFEILGFKEFCVVTKKRETYSFDNVHINLEDIKGFAPCVEIEILDDANIDENKKKLHKVMDIFEIDEKDRIDGSITSLYMEKNSFKKDSSDDRD